MSQEFIAIIGAVIGLAAPGERVGKVESTLGGRIARHEVATEGFIKSQSTPQ